MEKKPIIAVVGAASLEGTGLCQAVLNDPNSAFAIRAITDDPECEECKALANLGAQVAVSNLDDEEEVTAAFEGAHAAFCTTDYWRYNSVVRSQAQGRIMARAARANDLKHVIWLTLEDSREWVPLHDYRMPTLHGKYKVPYYDSKGSVDKIFTELELPVTFLRNAFYWDNLYDLQLGPSPGLDDEFELTLGLGDKRLNGMGAEDVGRCAYGIFKGGEKYIGQTIGLVSESLTGDEMAEKLSQRLGINVQYHPVSPETYRNLSFPEARHIGNLFQLGHDFEKELLANRDPKLTLELYPEVRNFDQWLADYAHKLHYRITGRDIMKWSANAGVLARQLYIYITKPNEGPTRVMQHVYPHLQYLFQLEREGILYGSGPLADSNGDEEFDGTGIVIIRARNIDHAREIAEADPMHKMGIRRFELTPWIQNEGIQQIRFISSSGNVEYL
jgi:uncharacterized protein YciI/uncharacterized protein YbjT (DUF2867 family)